MKMVEPPAVEVVSNIPSNPRDWIWVADAGFDTFRLEGLVDRCLRILLFVPEIDSFRFRVELIIRRSTQYDLVLVPSPLKRNVNFQLGCHLGAKVQDLVC